MHVGYEFAAAVALLTAIAAVLDYRTKKIPNWLTVSAAGLGLAYHSLAPGGMGPLLSLAGFAVGFSLLILPWLLGGGGMGDVKLLAALGAWMGPVLILVSFGVAAMLAACGAIAIMANSAVTEGFSTARRRYIQSASGGGTTTAASPPRKARRVLPFAVPVAMGAWLVLAWLLLRSQGA
ncbi:MAG: A24 family peptidase [Planctomycetaceae bacterium]|nr:A24 family peptidase [Planctomycetaceae bacterium]